MSKAISKSGTNLEMSPAKGVASFSKHCVFSLRVMCLCRYLAASPVESMLVPGAFVTSETATISVTTATIAVMTTAIIAGVTTMDAVMKATIIDATITLMTAAMIGVVLLSGVAEMIEMIAGGVGPAAGGGIAVQLA